MEQEYTSNIKVVGTVISDTKMILEEYLDLKDIELLKKEVIDNNLILKTSRRRSETIFNEIKKRYLRDQLEEYKETPLIYLLENIKTDSITDLILYYHLCNTEKIIYEYITQVAYEKYKHGYIGISSAETVDYIQSLAEKDKNISKWSERTINDVRSGMIGVLKEFGFIDSRKRPKFNKAFIPSIVFYYVLYMNKENIGTVNDFKSCNNFKLLFLLNEDINILLKEAYRNGVLEFDDSNNDKILIYKYKNIKEIIDGYVNGQIQ